MTITNENGKVTLQTLLKEYQSLKQDCSFRLGNLEEENRRIKKKAVQLRSEHDMVVEKLLPEQNKKKYISELSRNLTAFSLPVELLQMLNDEPVKIIDVGAFKLDGQEDLYSDLFQVYPSEVFGFEPQNDSIVTVSDGKCHKTIFPWAIGDGEKTNFFKTKYPAASSTLEPNHELVGQFLSLPSMLEVESKGEIETKRLDDIHEITDCDLLKIDVQGGELKVLEGATKLLANVSIVMTEVEFAPIYKNQPLFSDIDSFMRGQGFFLLDLCNKSHSSFKSSLFGDLKSRLMWADAVYVKEQELIEKLRLEKLLKALLLAHVVLHNPSLCCLLLELYDQKSQNSFLEAYQAQIHLMRRCYLS